MNGQLGIFETERVYAEVQCALDEAEKRLGKANPLTIRLLALVNYIYHETRPESELCPSDVSPVTDTPESPYKGCAKPGRR